MSCRDICSIGFFKGPFSDKIKPGDRVRAFCPRIKNYFAADVVHKNADGTVRVKWYSHDDDEEAEADICATKLRPGNTLAAEILPAGTKRSLREILHQPDIQYDKESKALPFRKKFRAQSPKYESIALCILSCKTDINGVKKYLTRFVDEKNPIEVFEDAFVDDGVISDVFLAYTRPAARIVTTRRCHSEVLVQWKDTWSSHEWSWIRTCTFGKATLNNLFNYPVNEVELRKGAEKLYIMIEQALRCTKGERFVVDQMSTHVASALLRDLGRDIDIKDRVASHGDNQYRIYTTDELDTLLSHWRPTWSDLVTKQGIFESYIFHREFTITSIFCQKEK